MSRYTPKRSIESLRQKWMAQNPEDPRLNAVGRTLVHAANEGPERFAQVCRELEPENDGQGGGRAGAKGGNYPNRSDLRTPPEPTGLPYGDRAKLNAARAAVPMGPPPAAAAPSGGGAGLPPQAAPAGPSPGDLPFLHPTQRPNEPVTAGIPQGPGPGPEVLTMNQGNPNDPLMMAVAALDSLGDTADAATKAVRDAVHTSIANRSVP